MRTQIVDDIETINHRLFELYRKWSEECFSSEVKCVLTKHNYNYPQLVRCFDNSYTDKRIMFFGKEAHDVEPWDYSNSFVKNEDFDTNKLWKYDKDILSSSALNTFYLKTRKLICNYKDCENYDERARSLFSVINNNLNKTAPKGNHEPFDGVAAKVGIYKEFIFEGCFSNIFMHELRILEPQKIILLCGKGYDLHIERAFGKEFMAKMYSARTQCDFFIKRDIGYSFEINGYEVLHCFHPSTHFRKEKRDEYNTLLKEFVSDSNIVTEH